MNAGFTANQEFDRLIILSKLLLVQDDLDTGNNAFGLAQQC